MTQMSSAVSLKGVTYAWPDAPVLLDIPQLDIEVGERVFLRGPSGSGKSTLLGLISGILTVSQGSLNVLGTDMAQASGRARDALRARDIGVIFQMFNLLPFLTVLQNTTLSCQFSSERRERLAGGPEGEARKILARLGLGDEAILQKKVSALSVGQQQRVAVARALLGNPKMVIADEPSSALDANARDRFMDLLFEEVALTKATLILVSHDSALAGRFDRALNLAEINRASQLEAVR